jgi:hypothetical protein
MNMKVFRVNDCDCVVAETPKEAQEWYMKEYRTQADECDGADEVAWDSEMWVDINDVAEEERKNIKEVSDNGELASMTYEWVYTKLYQDREVPFHISSTEF